MTKPDDCAPVERADIDRGIGECLVNALDQFGAQLIAVDAEHNELRFRRARLPLPELAQEAKRIGIQSVELLNPDEWAVVKAAGLDCAVGYAPAGDPRTQSFEVIVKAPPVAGLLTAGNTVEVRLPLGEPQRRLAVPRDALIIRAEGQHVFRLGAGQRAERIGVKPGVADGDWIAVDGQLKAGDRVVVRGGESLRGTEKLEVVGTLETQLRRADVTGTSGA